MSTEDTRFITSCSWCIIISSCCESERVVELNNKIILTLNECKPSRSSRYGMSERVNDQSIFGNIYATVLLICR